MTCGVGSKIRTLIGNGVRDKICRHRKDASSEKKLIMERHFVINMSLISLATFLAGLSLSLLSPFYPTEALTKGVTVSETGIVISSVFVTTILVTPVCGKYIQSLGARRFLIIGALIVGLGNASFGSLQTVSHHIPFLTLSVLIRVLTAVGESCVAPASYTLAGQQVSKEHSGKVVAVVETFFGFGTAMGPPVGGVLYDIGGFFLPFAVTGMMSVMVALASCCFLKEIRAEEREEEESRAVNITWWQIISTPGMLVCVAGMLVAGSGWSWVLASLEPFLKQRYGISASQTGLVFMAFGASYSLFSPMVGFLTDKGLNGLHAIILGNFLLFLGFLFIGPVPPLRSLASLELTTISLGVQGLGSAFTYIGSLVFMMRAALGAGLPDKEQTRAMVSGLWVISDCTGGYLGTQLGSLAFDTWGMETGTMMEGGVILASVVLVSLYTLLVTRRRDEGEEEARLRHSGHQVCDYQSIK